MICIACGCDMSDVPDYNSTHAHGLLCWECECPVCDDDEDQDND